MHNLFKNAKLLRLKPDGTNYEITAGTGDTLTSNSIDTMGFAGVAFILALGTVTATGTVAPTVQQSSDDGSSDAYVATTALIAAASYTSGYDVVIDVARPQERYLKLVTVRATANVVIDGLWAILYRPSMGAPAKDTTTAAQSFWQRPNE